MSPTVVMVLILAGIVACGVAIAYIPEIDRALCRLAAWIRKQVKP